MMMNLFSVFDPTSYFKLSLNWLVMIMLFMYIPAKYYLVSSGLFIFFKKISEGVGSIGNEISFPNHLVLNFVMLVVFLYITLSNVLGLFPFIFTSTAHPLVTMGWGVILWMSFFFMGFFKNFKKTVSHLVPEGSPILLAPFLVIIESVSHLIRPFTLSIRLAANMMAGHLIIGLLSSISLVSMWSFFVSLMMQNLLLILEFGVAMIQGFVFSILLLLYALEYY